MSERYGEAKQRCMKLPGGIKMVARKMGVAENTLHNWFKGKTTPKTEDLQRLKNLIESLEKEAEKEAERQRIEREAVEIGLKSPTLQAV